MRRGMIEDRTEGRIPSMLLMMRLSCAHCLREADAALSYATQLSLSGRVGVHSRTFVMFRRLLFLLSLFFCSLVQRVAFFFSLFLLGLRVLRSQQHKYTMVAGPVDYK